MAKCLILFLCLLASALAGVHQNLNFGLDFDGKIVGGSDAPDGQYPYQISLRYNGSHSCGGSIIDNEWILTAAHCVSGLEPFMLQVYAGSNQRSSGGTAYLVLEIHVHEGWNPSIIKNDVAVLKVAPITYTDKIQPIIVDTEEIGAGVSCTLSGWGRLWFPFGQVPENLQHIDLQTTDIDYCTKQLEPINPVGDKELCTFTEKGEGACKGDSGGPLVRKVNGKFQQIGIVSWAKPCARGLPDVFVKVSSYAPWIKETCNQCF